MVYIQLPLTGYWLHTMKAAIDTGLWLKLKYTVLKMTDRCPDVDPGRTQENLSTLYNFVIKIMPALSMNTCSLSHMRCTHGWPSCCAKLLYRAGGQRPDCLPTSQTLLSLQQESRSQSACIPNKPLPSYPTLAGRCKYTFQCQYNREG